MLWQHKSVGVNLLDSYVVKVKNGQWRPIEMTYVYQLTVITTVNRLPFTVNRVYLPFSNLFGYLLTWLSAYVITNLLGYLTTWLLDYHESHVIWSCPSLLGECVLYLTRPTQMMNFTFCRITWLPVHVVSSKLNLGPALGYWPTRARTGLGRVGWNPGPPFRYTRVLPLEG